MDRINAFPTEGGWGKRQLRLHNIRLSSCPPIRENSLGEEKGIPSASVTMLSRCNYRIAISSIPFPRKFVTLPVEGVFSRRGNGPVAETRNYACQQPAVTSTTDPFSNSSSPVWWRRGWWPRGRNSSRSRNCSLIKDLCYRIYVARIYATVATANDRTMDEKQLVELFRRNKNYAPLTLIPFTRSLFPR